MTIFLQLWFE